MAVDIVSQPEPEPDTATLLAEVSNAWSQNELLLEALEDLEVAAEDKGWRMLSLEMDREFSREGLQTITRNCTVMSIASPLIKKAMALRTGYVWGQGCTISARDEQVNKVIQEFWDDEMNATALASVDAQQTNERTLGTDGNICFAFFTDPRNGRVQVRTIPFQEMRDKISNPNDRDDVWYFYREYSTQVVEPGTLPGTFRSRAETRRVLHPGVGYRPANRPAAIDNIPVLWDQPILHLAVNRPTAHSKWGIPDTYAALPWARAYEGFLTDWAKLVKALSRFAWRVTGDNPGKAKKAAAAMRAAGGMLPELPDAPVGATVAMGPGSTLDAIPKSGATIDANSGRPLAGLVAAAMGVSVVDLLADPGVTGARAVAETLDKPIVLDMSGRQRLWASTIKTVLSYVVDASVKAPQGELKGSIIHDDLTDRDVVTLEGDRERTVDVDFPALDDLDPSKLVAAFEQAEGYGTPRAILVKLTLMAFKVKDVDEIMKKITDENGDLKDPELDAAAAAIQAQQRGVPNPAAADAALKKQQQGGNPAEDI